MKSAQPTIIPEEEYQRNLSRVQRDFNSIRFDELLQDEGLVKAIGWNRQITPTFKNFMDMTLPSANYRNEIEEVRALEALEKLLATYLSFNGTLSNAILMRKRMEKAEKKEPTQNIELTQRDNEMINVLSLYAGVNAAKEYIGEFAKADNSVKGLAGVDFSLERANVVKQIAKQFCVGMYANRVEGRIKNAQDFLESAELMFNGVLNDTNEARKRYEDLVELYDINELEIRLRDMLFTGFNYHGREAPEFNVKLTLDKIIGNDEFKKRGMAAVENVLSFDANSKKNIMMPFPLFYLVTGTPGCGKTVGAMALAKKFLDMAKDCGKDAEFFVLNSAKFKSEYQNKSANELYKIFTQKIFVPDRLYFVYMPDVDTIFSSRKSEGQRQEDNNILGVAFDIFDGTATPRTGHFAVFMDANYTDNMDPALLERFRKSTIFCQGPQTAEDYDRLLMEVSLKEGRENEYVAVSDEERKLIAQKMSGYRLSGRAVDSIALEAKDMANSFAKPEHWFEMSFEQQQAKIKELYRKIDGSFILDKIEHYQEFTQEQENREFDRKVKLIMDNMKVSRAAAERIERESMAIEKAKEIAGGASASSYSAGAGDGSVKKGWSLFGRGAKK